MNSTLDKIINLNKPSGPTSFSAVQSVKEILGVSKAGHIGTLDPLAEGVLPICLNRSTRIIQFLTHLPKVYKAEMTLGVTTDTQDQSGKILSKSDTSGVSLEQIKSVLAKHKGVQNQIPPMYSAKKKNGVPLYKLARSGITIDRKPVSIQIYSIEFLERDEDRILFRVECSAGTYIRTLCHDIGAQLGCGAHMSRLIRERVGSFRLENSLALEDIKSAQTNGTLTDKLCHEEEALNFLPEVRVKKDFVKPVCNGVALSKSSLESFPGKFKPGMNLRVLNGNDNLLAIAEPMIDQDGLPDMEPDDIVFRLKRVLKSE